MYEKKIDGGGNVLFVVRLSDGAWIPADTDNTAYREYLAWVEKGNVPQESVLDSNVWPWQHDGQQ